MIKLVSPGHFLTKSETKILMTRVAEFENETGCQLLFHFRRKLGVSPLETNRELFFKFKLNETKHHNAILVTLALAEKKFAIWADEGVIRKTGDKLWHEVSRAMSKSMSHGQHLGALLEAMDISQQVLALEQPQDLRSEGNELPNNPLIEDE